MQNLKLSKTHIATIASLVGLLVLVRVFQERLFYDPLLAFFKGEEKILPAYDGSRLCLGLAFRYALNSGISIAIIYALFRDRPMLRLAAILYAAFFVVLIAAFFGVANMDHPNLLALFYIRRFLIQPLFLILFVPAFYYQKKQS